MPTSQADESYAQASLLDKPKQSGGMVVLTGVATNQSGDVVAEALGKILVARRG